MRSERPPETRTSCFLPVSAGTTREALRAGETFCECARAELELELQGSRQLEIVLEIGAHPIAAHRLLRERGELGRELLGGGAGLAGRDDAVHEADRERFVGVDGAAGEDEIERAGQA